MEPTFRDIGTDISRTMSWQAYVGSDIGMDRCDHLSKCQGPWHKPFNVGYRHRYKSVPMCPKS
eukprot:5683813-Karenia_brevis.AAC.1